MWIEGTTLNGIHMEDNVIEGLGIKLHTVTIHIR